MKGRNKAGIPEYTQEKVDQKLDIKTDYYADVLYVSILPKRPARSEEVADNILLRKDLISSKCIGITIVGFLENFVRNSNWSVLSSFAIPINISKFFKQLEKDPSQVNHLQM